MGNHDCMENDFIFTNGYYVCKVCGNSIKEFSRFRKKIISRKHRDEKYLSTFERTKKQSRSQKMRNQNYIYRREDQLERIKELFINDFNPILIIIKEFIQKKENKLLKTDFLQNFEKMSFKLLQIHLYDNTILRMYKYKNKFGLIFYLLIKYYYEKQKIKRYYYQRDIDELCQLKRDCIQNLLKNIRNREGGMNKMFVNLFKDTILEGVIE
jgi:GH15 family glucan-1,4-alpha-glucosidase